MRKHDALEARTGGAQPAFVVWLSYQRRSEILAPLVGCTEIAYFPSCFRRKLLRPLDYFIKLFQTIAYFRRVKPSYAILQAPPLFSALAALVTRTPYVVDVHNGLVQSFWSKIPLTEILLRRAIALIAHNFEIADVLQHRTPAARVITIRDPIHRIGGSNQFRNRDNILFICSFDRDEPVALILDIIRALPEYKFTITANLQKLPHELRIAYQNCSNLYLSGFLETADYHVLLSSSHAAVVLSTMPSVQPSGAVEALSSDTPLIVSRTTLTAALFGDWAILCDNNLESVVAAIRSVAHEHLDLQAYRTRWNQEVSTGIDYLQQIIGRMLLSPPQ